MSSKSVKVYKNFPLNYKIRKPRYWYIDKTITPNGSTIIEENLEAYEGMQKEVYNNNATLKIERTKLWNNTYIDAGEYVLAPEKRIIDGEEVDAEYLVSSEGVVKKLKGCGKVIAFPYRDTVYEMYRNVADGKISLSGKTIPIIDTPDKTWFGDLTVGLNFNPKYYTKNYEEMRNCIYSTDDSYNILTTLSPYGYLLTNTDKKYVFTDIPNISYYPYTYRFTIKVKTGTVDSSSRVLGRFGFPDWFGIVGQKFGISGKITLDFTASSNTTYWLRIEEYCDGNGNYTHTLRSIVDNGYTINTLPDNSSWTSKAVTNNEKWLSSSSEIKQFGEKSTNTDYSWNGTIDLTNTWFDKDLDGRGFVKFWTPLEEA
jgi:hypothetical protein